MPRYRRCSHDRQALTCFWRWMAQQVHLHARQPSDDMHNGDGIFPCNWTAMSCAHLRLPHYIGQWKAGHQRAENLALVHRS